MWRSLLALGLAACAATGTDDSTAVDADGVDTDTPDRVYAGTLQITAQKEGRIQWAGACAAPILVTVTDEGGAFLRATGHCVLDSRPPRPAELMLELDDPVPVAGSVAGRCSFLVAGVSVPCAWEATFEGDTLTGSAFGARQDTRVRHHDTFTAARVQP